MSLSFAMSTPYITHPNKPNTTINSSLILSQKPDPTKVDKQDIQRFENLNLSSQEDYGVPTAVYTVYSKNQQKPRIWSDTGAKMDLTKQNRRSSELTQKHSQPLRTIEKPIEKPKHKSTRRASMPELTTSEIPQTEPKLQLAPIVAGNSDSIVNDTYSTKKHGKLSVLADSMKAALKGSKKTNDSSRENLINFTYSEMDRDKDNINDVNNKIRFDSNDTNNTITNSLPTTKPKSSPSKDDLHYIRSSIIGPFYENEHDQIIRRNSLGVGRRHSMSSITDNTNKRDNHHNPVITDEHGKPILFVYQPKPQQEKDQSYYYDPPALSY